MEPINWKFMDIGYIVVTITKNNFLRNNNLFIKRISDSGEISLEGRKSWILNWLGKVACEVFCSSSGSGKAYRSKEAILVLRESVSLRVEFQFSSVIDFSVAHNFFQKVIHSEVSMLLERGLLSIE
jgi:hypothetical protein